MKEQQYQIRSGVKAVAAAGTAVPLAASKTFARKLRISAPAGNTGVVYLGDSNVDSTNGYVLAAGGTLPLEDMLGSTDERVVVDLNTIYVDAANNDDSVTFVYWDLVD